MRRETTDAQEIGARRETLDAPEARRETRNIRRVSSLSSCNLVSRLTSHATAPWPKVKLGDVAIGIYDGPHATPPPCDKAGYYFLGIPQITPAGHIDLSNPRYISKEDYAKWTKRVVPCEGDVIFSYEATLNLYAMIPKDMRCCLGRRMGLVRPDTAKLDARFLYYYFFSPEWRKTVVENTVVGATVDRLPIKTFPSFKISLPPLPVQRRIADVLSAYDDLIENNRRRIAILEETARLAYRKWFGGSGAKGGMRHETIDASEAGRETRDVRRVSSLPSHARVSRLTSHAQLRTVTLGEICREVRRGVNPDAIAPDTPYIGLEHMPRRSISLYEWESAQKITSTKLAFETGDILFGKIRPYFHKVGIAFVDGVASSDAIVIKPNRPELLAYVLMTVSSDAFVAAASQGMKEGSKMPRADWKQLLRYCVVLPDAETLSAFNKVLNPILAQLKALCFSIRNLAATRDMLLPRLMKRFSN